MSSDVNFEIAPSILSADFCCLLDEIKQVEGYAKYLHIDVMDGHYVPNISFGIPVINKIRPHTDMIFDVHLMITNPDEFIEKFAKVGADAITFHIECTDDPKALIDKIHSLGKKAGIAIHPDTPVDKVFPYLKDLEIVLLMSVIPGLGGQKFMEDAPSRLRTIREELDRVGSKALLSVDGGIHTQTIETAVKSGARLLVAGSAVFDTPDHGKAVEDLKCAVNL